jgi:ATP-dependent DNA ligase
MIRAVVWDVIPLEQFHAGRWDKAYTERLTLVLAAVRGIPGHLAHLVSLVETCTVASEDAAQKKFQEYFAQGEEGIILKDAKGIWEDKRAKHQIKYKGELECDLVCVDFEGGTGKYRGMLGALVLESADGKVKVSVGSGFTDEMRQLRRMDVFGKIVTVKYNARIRSKSKDADSLFLPVLLEIREDKTKADKSEKIA